MTELFVWIIYGIATVEDIKTMKISNYLSISLLGYGFFCCIFQKLSFVSGCFSFIFVLLLLTVIVLCADIFLKKQSLGGGDVKLISSTAFVLGAEQTLWILLISQVLCLAYVLCNHLINSRKITKLPLAPFLFFALTITITILGGK